VAESAIQSSLTFPVTDSVWGFCGNTSFLALARRSSPVLPPPGAIMSPIGIPIGIIPPAPVPAGSAGGDSPPAGMAPGVTAGPVDGSTATGSDVGAPDAGRRGCSVNVYVAPQVGAFLCDI
jgi:hypothetical protein